MVTCCDPVTRLAGVTTVPVASSRRPEPDAPPASTRTTDGPTCAISWRSSAWIWVRPPGGTAGAGGARIVAGVGLVACATSAGVANRTGNVQELKTAAAVPAAMAMPSHRAYELTPGSLESDSQTPAIEPLEFAVSEPLAKGRGNGAGLKSMKAGGAAAPKNVFSDSS